MAIARFFNPADEKKSSQETSVALAIHPLHELIDTQLAKLEPLFKLVRKITQEDLEKIRGHNSEYTLTQFKRYAHYYREIFSKAHLFQDNVIGQNQKLTSALSALKESIYLAEKGAGYGADPDKTIMNVQKNFECVDMLLALAAAERKSAIALEVYQKFNPPPQQSFCTIL